MWIFYEGYVFKPNQKLNKHHVYTHISFWNVIFNTMQKAQWWYNGTVMILLYGVSIFCSMVFQYTGKIQRYMSKTCSVVLLTIWSVRVQMELEALRSIYEGDDCFKELSSVSFQYRVRTAIRHKYFSSVVWKVHKYTKYCLLWLTVMFYLCLTVQIQGTL